MKKKPVIIIIAILVLTIGILGFTTYKANQDLKKVKTVINNLVDSNKKYENNIGEAILTCLPGKDYRDWKSIKANEIAFVESCYKNSPDPNSNTGTMKTSFNLNVDSIIVDDDHIYINLEKDYPEFKKIECIPVYYFAVYYWKENKFKYLARFDRRNDGLY